jgi:two-component system sensor histidine kinase KdpD
MRTRGVMAIEPTNNADLGPEQLQLLDTCASLLAISLERIHYISVAQTSSVQIESEKLRNSLLSAISHDIRTPLASMLGLIDTLNLIQPPISEEHRHIVTSIKKSAFRMNALVHNLLDMARLEAGSVQLNQEWQPIEECIGTALESCQFFLQDHPLTVELPLDIPLLKIDAVLIERVFVNLIENASKYTPSGTSIRISGFTKADHAVIRVEDFGQGIPSGMENSVFEKFERGHKEESIPGVGLGLTICRTIMQAHQGSIRAFNKREGGACFELSFPIGTPPKGDGSQLFLDKSK